MSDWKNKHEAKREDGNSFWPFPRKGQKVFCGCCRDEVSPDDPMKHCGCGCWWWCYMMCGADESLFVDYDEKGYLKEICDMTNSPYPPMGRERKFDIDLDTIPTPLPEELYKHHFNIQTLFYHLRLHVVLGAVKRFYPLYFILQCIFCAVIPCIWILLVYALIPMSDPKGDREDCDFRKFACWLFFTNPISEISIVVANITLLFASLDDDLPWRPFKYYLPLLTVVYFAQVLFFLPFVLTSVKTFPYQGIVAFFISDLVTFIWMIIMKDRIINFREEERSKEATEHMHTRYSVYLKSIWMRFSAVCVYAAYLYGIQKLSDAAISGLNILMALLTVLFRVLLQRTFSVFHKDMNFYLAFLALYGGVSMYFVFATPAFEGGFENFITAAIGPITYIVWGFLHQAELWFRFRCWLKKCYYPVFCCGKNHLLALAIWEDVDFHGRGSDNFFPSYQRTKIQNEICSMMATMYSSLFYLCVSPSLRHLPNRKHFPFFEISDDDDDDVLVVAPTGDRGGFSNSDWNRSLLFASLVFAYVTASMLLYRFYLFFFFPSLRPVFREFMWKAHEQPHKLGYQMMIVTMMGMGVVKMFLSYSRIWWVEADLCE